MNRLNKIWMGIGGALMALVLLCIAATPPPVNRNPFSTNVPPGPLIFTNVIIFTNASGTGAGWIQVDVGGMAFFDKNGQEGGRIYSISSNGVAMQFAAGFSGLFTNGTWVVHTRDGTKVPLQIEGDFTSQTTFLIQCWTNSGTAQNTFTVDSGGTIYSRALLSYRALYTDGNSNIVSATSTALSYLANTQQINFASTPYQTFVATNDTVFTNQNQQSGRAVAVKFRGNNTNVNLSFPAAWIFLGGGAPTFLSSNKEAILSLTAYGTDPTNIIAAYAVQP